MSDKKTLIDKIKEMVFAEDTVEAKFLDVKDSEGNILRVDAEELAQGQVLWLVGEEELLPTPDAEYILEDGRTIKTDAESIIIEIIEAEEEMSEEDVVTETAPTLEEKINTTINRKTAELEEKLDNLLAKFEAFSNAPAEEEIKIEKVGFKKNEITDNAINALSKFRNKK